MDLCKKKERSHQREVQRKVHGSADGQGPEFL